MEYIEIEKNRSRATIDNYNFYLNRFARWFGDKDVNTLTPEKIRHYRLWLNRFEEHGNPLKKSTQNYHLIALRSMLKYLAREDVKTMAPEKIELMRMPEREVSFLTREEVERLLAAPMADQGENRDDAFAKTRQLVQLRDRAILETLFSTGLRVAELAGLKKEDVNLQRGEFGVRGKGSKRRLVFLSKNACTIIENYLKARTDLSPYLFASHDRAKKGRTKKASATDTAPLTTRSVQRLVKKYAMQSGIMKDCQGWLDV